MPRKWQNYDEDEQLLLVALLRGDGFTDEAIGTFFSSTKGVIVGFRHRRLPKFINLPKASKSSVQQKRLDELLADKEALTAARNVIAANEGVVSPYVGKKKPASDINRPVPTKRNNDSGSRVEMPKPTAIKKTAKKAPVAKKEKQTLAAAAKPAPIETPTEPRREAPLPKPAVAKMPQRYSELKKPAGVVILSDPITTPRLTTNEALQCTFRFEDRKQCGYAFEDEKTKRCRFHPL